MGAFTLRPYWHCSSQRTGDTLCSVIRGECSLLLFVPLFSFFFSPQWWTVTQGHHLEHYIHFTLWGGRGLFMCLGDFLCHWSCLWSDCNTWCCSFQKITQQVSSCLVDRKHCHASGGEDSSVGSTKFHSPLWKCCFYHCILITLFSIQRKVFFKIK